MDIRFYDVTNPRKKRDNVEEDFELQMSAPSAVFAYYLSSLRVKDEIRQINIFCDKNTTDIDLNQNIIDGFWDITVPYDPNILLSIKQEKVKKEEIKLLITDVFTRIYTFKGWEVSDFKRAIFHAEQMGFTLEFLLKGTPKKSPNRKHIAIVKCTEDIKSFKMVCSIYDRYGVLISEKLIVETMPSSFTYQQFIGKPIWESNEIFSIEAKHGKWKESVDIR